MFGNRMWQVVRQTGVKAARMPSLSVQSMRPLTTETPAAPTTFTAPTSSLNPDIAKTAFDHHDPLISQLVNTIMRDGKKARAQRIVNDSLKYLAEKSSSDPYTVLSEVIETASPLLKLTSNKKGSKVVHIPTPLRERQRRRRAIVWIIEAAAKRNDKTFAERFAAEVYDVSQGTSTVLQKKMQLHKQALANRANAQVSYNTQSR